MSITADFIMRVGGRYPTDWVVPNAEEIGKTLKSITLLIRVPLDDESGEDSLHAIITDGIDIYNTDITNRADISWEPEEIKGLKVRFAWSGKVPIAHRWAVQDSYTVEDVFQNISVKDLKPGTLVEVYTRFVKIEHDDILGQVWRAVFLVYDREN